MKLLAYRWEKKSPDDMIMRTGDRAVWTGRIGKPKAKAVVVIDQCKGASDEEIRKFARLSAEGG